MDYIERKLSGFILKMDFEKAYNRGRFPLLQHTFRMKGFPEERRALFYRFVTRGNLAKINNDVGRYFHTKKVLRQGEPLSSMLFNIVIDILVHD
jgi:hypothetical protein